MATAKTLRIQVEERRVNVATLMRAGTKQRDMARALNVSVGTINRDVQAILAEWRKDILNEVEAAKSLDLERIEAIVRANWQKALAGNFGAQDRVVRCIELRKDIYGYGGKSDEAAAPPAPLTIIEVVRPADTRLVVSSSDQAVSG